MVLGEIDEWQKDGFNSDGKEQPFIPVVGDVCEMKNLFKAKIENTNQHAMKAQNEHRTDGNCGNKSRFEAIK